MLALPAPAFCPPVCSNVKRQLRAAVGERDVAAQRANELTQQLQDKKRQLFTAIQVRNTTHSWLAGWRAGLPCSWPCHAGGWRAGERAGRRAGKCFRPHAAKHACSAVTALQEHSSCPHAPSCLAAWPAPQPLPPSSSLPACLPAWPDCPAYLSCLLPRAPSPAPCPAPHLFCRSARACGSRFALWRTSAESSRKRCSARSAKR